MPSSGGLLHYCDGSTLMICRSSINQLGLRYTCISTLRVTIAAFSFQSRTLINTVHNDKCSHNERHKIDACAVYNISPHTNLNNNIIFFSFYPLSNFKP